MGVKSQHRRSNPIPHAAWVCAGRAKLNSEKPGKEFYASGFFTFTSM